MKSLTRSIRLLSLLICMSLLPFGQGALAADNIPSAAPSVLNAGFEEPVTGEKIPGWSLTFGAGYSDMSYEVTSADAYEGNYSLLLDDRNTSRALGLESDPFPITPGAQYIVSAMMKVERSNLAIYIRYFDADGVKLGETSNWLASTDGQWVRNSAFTKAPDDAVTATILLYSSSTGTGRGYMDQIMIGEVQMGTFEQIGSVVNGSINLTGTVGMENGTHVMYTVYKGRDDVPTNFVVIDVLTREVLKSYPMPGVESAWAVEVATDGSVYIGTHYNGGLYRYSPDDGSFEHIGRFGNETHVWAMAPGPDGKIYAGTYPNAKVYEYDPADGQIKDLGRTEPTEKYVRSMAYDAERSELYVGVGGTRSKVFKMNVEDGTYKELLSGLLPDGGESYAFPYGMKFAEDRLFVKFSNGDLLVIRGEDEALEYSLEGALSAYNFATGELDVYSNIIPNQSIVSLVYKDGLVYGGSTIYGGLGTDGPAESEGKLFIFDPETKSKIFETVPVAGRRGVTGLTVGPDGMIWGIAEDHIFTFNPDTRTVETSISKLKRYGSSTTWAYGFLRTGIDGNVYGTSRGQFFMVKPDSMDFIMLNGSIGNYLNQDKYGNFYFSDNSSNLWKYTPPMSEELLQSLLDQSYEKGWIRQQGILNSLQVKLKNNNLTDFIREVQAQRGKHVSEDAASLFIYLAERLVNYK